MIFTKLTDKNQLKDGCNYVIVVSGMHAPLHGILLAKWASWGEFHSSAGFTIGREHVTHFCEVEVNDH